MQVRLDDIAVFVRVAELGTLSAAARERDIPVSQVTRSLARLEACCGARLMHRSTHGLSLTDEGGTTLAYGRRLLETAGELEGALTGRVNGPSGWVRVSVSLVVAETVIAPSLPGLYERHPQLHIDLTADDRVVDLARDGVEIAIRTGELVDDHLVARRLGHFGRAVVASPSYLERFGAPQTVAELSRHRLISFSANPQMNRWPHSGKDEAADFPARGHTRSDNIMLTLALVRQGAGIARVMDLLALPLIRRGELVAVLQDQINRKACPSTRWCCRSGTDCPRSTPVSTTGPSGCPARPEPAGRLPLGAKRSVISVGVLPTSDFCRPAGRTRR